MDPYKDFIRLPGWLYHLLAETPFLWIVIPIVSLALVLIPFIIVWRKCKPVRWQEVGVAFLSSLLIFGGLEFLMTKLDRWIWWHIYNGGWILGQYESGTLTYWFLFTFLIIFSPFPIFKVIYKKLKWKKFFICVFLSILLACIMIWLWLQFLAWGFGNISDHYL